MFLTANFFFLSFSLFPKKLENSLQQLRKIIYFKHCTICCSYSSVLNSACEVFIVSEGRKDFSPKYKKLSFFVRFFSSDFNLSTYKLAYMLYWRINKYGLDERLMFVLLLVFLSLTLTLPIQLLSVIFSSVMLFISLLLLSVRIYFILFSIKFPFLLVKIKTKYGQWLSLHHLLY